MTFPLFFLIFLSRSDFEVDGFTYHVLDQDQKTVQVVQCSKSADITIKIPNKVKNENDEYSVVSISKSAFDKARQFSTIYFPSTLTDIEEETFYDFKNLTRIGYTDENGQDVNDTLPPLITVIRPSTFYATSIVSINSENVVNLEEACFASCSSLVSAKFSSKLETIGDESFHGCISLESFEIGEKVTDIGTSAFRTCYNLKSIDMNNVKTVYNYAFQYCASLTSVNLKNVEIIGEYVFADLEKLSTIELPSSLTELHSYCFMRTPLKTVTGNPGKVKEIKRSFAFCESLVSVPKFESVEIVNNESFYYCTNLERFETGDKLKSVGENTFSYCNKLKDFVTTSKEFTVDHYGFRQCYVLTNFPFSSVTAMSNNSFESCNAFNVVDLSKSSLTDVPYHAFFRCTGLKEVILPPNLASISSTSPFQECPVEKVTFTGTKGFVEIGLSFANFDKIKEVVFAETCMVSLNSTFANCINLLTVTLPSQNVTLIDAFSGCSALQKVVNFNSVVKLDGAFTNCMALNSLEGVSEIAAVGERSFENCQNLASLSFTNKLTSIGNRAFLNCLALTSIGDVTGIESIGELSFSNCQKITSLHHGGKITEIKDGAFQNCTLLSDFDDCTNVKTVGENSFENCESLASLKFTNKLTSIGNSAFRNCYALTSIGEPTEIESIGDFCFANCQKITSFYFNSKLTKINDCAFSNCSSLSSVTFPSLDKSLTIGSKAFESCEAIEKVFIEQAPTVIISKEAFLNCNSLVSLNFTITDLFSIGEYAFFNCPINDTITFDSKEIDVSHHAFSTTTLNTIDFTPNINKLTLFDDSFDGCSSVNCVMANSSSPLIDVLKVAFNEKIINGEFCPVDEKSKKSKKTVIIVGVAIGVVVLILIIVIIIVVVRKRKSNYQVLDDNQSTLFNTVNSKN